MTIGCKRLPLDECEPGMKLADKLADAAGNVLLPSGATLTAASLSSLQRRGISVVPVEFEMPALSKEEIAARLATLDKRLDTLFRRCGNSGGLGAVRQYVAGYRAGELK